MEIGAPLHSALVVKADELTAQRDADINAVAKDFDDADPVYTSDLVLGRVVRELHGRGAMARLVDFGWSFSAERLVRPDIVEVDQPSIAVALLRSTRARRRQLELSQVAVHALVAAIVLRLFRARTNQSDAERHCTARRNCSRVGHALRPALSIPCCLANLLPFERIRCQPQQTFARVR